MNFLHIGGEQGKGKTVRKRYLSKKAKLREGEVHMGHSQEPEIVKT